MVMETPNQWCLGEGEGQFGRGGISVLWPCDDKRLMMGAFIGTGVVHTSCTWSNSCRVFQRYEEVWIEMD